MTNDLINAKAFFQNKSFRETVSFLVNSIREDEKNNNTDSDEHAEKLLYLGFAWFGVFIYGNKDYLDSDDPMEDAKKNGVLSNLRDAVAYCSSDEIRFEFLKNIKTTLLDLLYNALGDYALAENYSEIFEVNFSIICRRFYREIEESLADSVYKSLTDMSIKASFEAFLKEFEKYDEQKEVEYILLLSQIWADYINGVSEDTIEHIDTKRFIITQNLKQHRLNSSCSDFDYTKVSMDEAVSRCVEILKIQSQAADVCVKYNYDKFITQGEVPEVIKAYEWALNILKRLSPETSYPLLADVISIKKTQPSSDLISETSHSSNSPSSTSDSCNTAEKNINDPKFIFNIENTPSNGECEKCKKIDEVYPVTLSRMDKSKKMNLCKSCACLVKKGADRKNDVNNSSEISQNTERSSNSDNAPSGIQNSSNISNNSKTRQIVIICSIAILLVLMIVFRLKFIIIFAIALAVVMYRAKEYPNEKFGRFVLGNPIGLFLQLLFSKKGSVIYFGTYEDSKEKQKRLMEWEVIDKKIGKVLVICRECTDALKYNEEYVPITWETCSLRKWLNNDFLNHFTQEEQSKIIQSSVSTDGSGTTMDKAFILSYDELHSKYSNAKKYCFYTYEAGCKARKMITTNCGSGRKSENRFYWLRSSGPSKSAQIQFDDGLNVNISHHNINTGEVETDDLLEIYDVGLVRPAMWLNLF